MSPSSGAQQGRSGSCTPSRGHRVHVRHQPDSQEACHSSKPNWGCSMPTSKPASGSRSGSTCAWVSEVFLSWTVTVFVTFPRAHFHTTFKAAWKMLMMSVLMTEADSKKKTTVCSSPPSHQKHFYHLAIRVQWSLQAAMRAKPRRGSGNWVRQWVWHEGGTGRDGENVIFIMVRTLELPVWTWTTRSHLLPLNFPRGVCGYSSTLSPYLRKSPCLCLPRAGRWCCNWRYDSVY